ncbi:GGDEF domain-containing phosphodiesterase [Clostridium estertheticum]|uniref:putative bifunctional diguanylate cyclase/phosphodiesterase n=1 Tax=Clostridium estertheticum TaxID=238834 RepID=UPI001C7CE2A2|nr:GGDEF domain-containing phosphodiesterase [Clostridium estertheticum]MBX4260856.1 GGDEF domain-containing phosphodiesterase [Clostridium estertheticum]WLC71537.1 GGDEF domain-containing phosphodiesterase [Clostridium estertheticum]
MYKRNSMVRDNALYNRAYFDFTTGLRNKNYIDYMLPEVMRHKGNCNYQAINIDVENFNILNENLGYDLCNKLLKEVAKILSNIFNKKSIVIYCGFNRFLIISFKEKHVNDYARKILNDLKNKFIIGSRTINLTISMGIYVNTKCENIFTAIQNAYIALNYAKKQEGDCFSIFNTSMESQIFKKEKMQKNLKEAIRNDLLDVYYQPKINLDSETLMGVEALLRWNDDELGTILPIEFINIAEETGIIIDLGRYVLRKVCKQIKTWEESGVEYRNVAVNLSAKQFKDVHLPEYIGQILNEYGVSPNVLELEITESAVIENTDLSNNMISKIIKKGIKIAIDDFGTGYSSYIQLSNLSLNTLKINKSFIDFINYDNKKNLIIKNIIEFAHILDMKVVAEGVEQEQQMITLKEYGCDIIQGFYYSKPLSAKNFEEYIREKEGKC